MAWEPRPPRHHLAEAQPRNHPLLRAVSHSGGPVTPASARPAPTQGPDPRSTPAGSRRRLPDAQGAPRRFEPRAGAEGLPAPHALPAGPGRVRAAPPPPRPRPAAAPPRACGVGARRAPRPPGRARVPAPGGARSPVPSPPGYRLRGPGWVQNPADRAQFASPPGLLSTAGSVSVCPQEKVASGGLGTRLSRADSWLPCGLRPPLEPERPLPW